MRTEVTAKRRVMKIPVWGLDLDRDRILDLQGVPPSGPGRERSLSLLTQAIDMLAWEASPVGMTAEVSAKSFADVFAGEGRNEPRTPLASIFPRASSLALFATTLGPAVSRRIRDLFDEREFALGTMLDAVASEAAECAGDFLERRYRKELDRGAATPPPTLRYSPGYCGWHVSGQRKLFNVLQPAEIGITLRESFLMEPLKSISGIIVAGPAEIHDFENDFPFCDGCRDWSCRERIRRLHASEAS